MRNCTVVFLSLELMEILSVFGSLFLGFRQRFVLLLELQRLYCAWQFGKLYVGYSVCEDRGRCLVIGRAT